MTTTGPDEDGARRIARRVLEECGIDSLPVDPRRIADHKNIHYRESPLESGVSGALINVHSRFGILVADNAPNDGHKRFSGAHELGHYHLPGHLDRMVFEERSYLCDPPVRKRGTVLEREANYFASELLMPANLLADIFERTEPGLASIKAIAEECETSVLSSALRYVHQDDHPGALVVSHEGTVEFSYVAPSFWSKPVAISRPRSGRPVPEGTATYQLSEDDEAIADWGETSTTLPVKTWFPEVDGSGEFTEEVIGLGEYGRVLTFLKA